MCSLTTRTGESLELEELPLSNMLVFIHYLVLPRCGEPGLDDESLLLVVSIREALLWSCLPADDSGLFTAPKTFADLGLRLKEEMEKGFA